MEEVSTLGKWDNYPNICPSRILVAAAALTGWSFLVFGLQLLIKPPFKVMMVLNGRDLQVVLESQPSQHSYGNTIMI